MRSPAFRKAGLLTLPPCRAPAAAPHRPRKSIRPRRRSCPLGGRSAAFARLQAAADGCPLYRDATQTVFGAGLAKAPLMLIGETPGDREDQAGKPFVGPAGELLDHALEAAGLDRSKTYVTNAVKHFKWEPRGKRRLHAKPSAREIAACRPWLDAEIEVVKPRVIVCLGATAAQALLGRTFRITKSRGQLQASAFCDGILPTYHPSAVLRAPSSEDRARMRAELIDDLKVAARSLKSA